MSALPEIASAIASIIICGLAFGGGAYLWIGACRRDELDRRAKREIERATHHAMNNPQDGHVGRRKAA